MSSMDLPHLIHHQNPRYVPFSPPPPPPPPPTRPHYPDDPNFHNPRPPNRPHYPQHHFHHRLHQPPASQPPAIPPPPPPQSSSYLPPPPPPYNPSQSQFTFSATNHNRPFEDDHSRPSQHLRLPSDRPRHRLPEFDRSYPESRKDFWDSSRIMADNRPERPYTPLSFDSDPRKLQYDHKPIPLSPFRTAEKFRHDSEGISRIRGEYDEGFEFKYREEMAWGREDEKYYSRGQLQSSSDASFRELGFMSDPIASSRDLELNSGSNGGRYGVSYDDEIFRSGKSDEIRENPRWVHDRKHSSWFERGSAAENSNSNGKREHYGSDLGRYSNRGSKDGSHEYNRTPKKQFQKKSALLRIQMAKPHRRNTESGQVHYSGYLDNSSSNSYRWKDQNVYLSPEMDEDEREESPVELDVSFKSNALVAKAIVAPSSSSDFTDLIPRNRKVMKDSVSDGDCLSSEQTKLGGDAANLRSSSHVAYNTTTAGKELIKSEAKVTSGFKNSLNPDLSKLSEVTVNSPSSTHVAINTSTSDKESTKSQGKVTSGIKNSRLNSELTKLSEDTVNFHSSAHVANIVSNSDKESRKSEGTVTSGNKDVCNNRSVDSARIRSGKLSSPKVSKKKKVVKKIVKHSIHPRSCRLSSQPTKKNNDPVITGSCVDSSSAAIGTYKGLTSSPFPCPFVKKKTEEGSPMAMATKEFENDVNSRTKSGNKVEKNANSSSYALGPPSSLEKYKIDMFPENADKSVDINTLDNVGCVIDVKQSCKADETSRHENVLEKESSKTMLPGEGNFDPSLSNSGEMKIHEDLMSVYYTDNDTDTALDIVKGVEMSKMESTTCDVGTVDALSDQPCGTKVTTSAGCSATIGLSSSGESIMNADASQHGRGFNCVSDRGCSNYEENIFSNSQTIDCAAKKPSPDSAAGLPENDATERSPTIKASVGDMEGEKPIIKKKRTVRTMLDFSRTSDVDLEPINVSNSPTAVDATLSLTLKDHSCEEAVSCDGSLDFGLQPGVDGNSSLDGFPGANFLPRPAINNGSHEAPSLCRKRRKVSASHLASCSLTASLINEQSENTSMSYIEAPSTSNVALTQKKNEAGTSSIDTLCDTTNLMPCEKEIVVWLGNKLVGGSSDASGADGGSLNDENLKAENQRASSYSTIEESKVPSLPLCPSESEIQLEKDDASLIAVKNHQNDFINLECNREEKLGVHALKEQFVIHDETAQCTIPSNFQPPDVDQRLTCTSVEYDDLLVKGSLPCMSNDLSLSADGHGVSTSTSNDELMEIVADTLSDTGSPQTSLNVSDSMLDGKESLSQMSNGIYRNDKNLDDKSVFDGGSDVSAQASLSQSPKINLKSDHGTEVLGKTVSLPIKDSKSTFPVLNNVTSECNEWKNQMGHSIPKIFPGRASSVYTMVQKTTPSSHAKARTWHRNGNSSDSSHLGSNRFRTVLPKRQKLPEREGKFRSTSYVRKGNSLVRKPSLVAPLPQDSHGVGLSVYRLNSVGTDDVKKGTGSGSRADVSNSPSLLRMGGMNAYFDRPSTSLEDNKLPNSTAILPGDWTSSLLAEPRTGCSETMSDPMPSSEANYTVKFAEDSLGTGTLENQNGKSNSVDNQTEQNRNSQSNSLDNQMEQTDGNLPSSNMRRIVYVKRKSNQLVATSNSSDLSIPNADKIQPSYFDGYYKKRQNQLIRTPLEGQTKQSVIADDNLNSVVQGAPKVISSRFGKRRSYKVIAKTCKPSKSSLVWTLSKKDGGSLDHQKVVPSLFPWKRATYWRSFIQNRNFFPKNSSLSVISRKLLLSRKQDAVYTRSTNGFSLRKSKVLSVGGSSLKWSKSIEKCSKKANEEATIAVAEVERKKREQNQAAKINPGSKNRNHSPRERIFRIGSVRYKMDPSRRTLQRISDGESSCSASPCPDKDAKRSYIPRRLVIGNDEYIRIGNGNQLIRDPKKRTRILANEKIRWSLHTARLRLARKRKYCQFFTRFGKCNKDDGKCPYIHDRSKVAVCTKFLNGLCVNANCKLTHKVIPERMPDCSFFLQGLCTNQNCPYRHVNVNPKASTCKEFLRGYCADGNECRKKHSYVCPTFEATGTCPQGSKCKLHHPKNRTKGKKRKQTRKQKNDQGRYFGSIHVSAMEPIKAVCEKLNGQARCQNGIVSEGKFGDFVPIDVSDDEAGESNGVRVEQAIFYDSDLSQFELDDLDELIKPVRIMDRNLMRQSFLDHSSSNVKTC